jgi:GNAT superfamily N-acetyltransferase
MLFREAQVADIDQLSAVRLSVKENVLSNPALITRQDYVEFLTLRGKGWLCEIESKVVGFAINDLQAHNIWALFVRPENEDRGIGKKLHELMLDWYFEQTKETVWLSTAPNSRAATFYKKAGWVIAGLYGKGEVKFEMTYHNWLQHST